MGWLFKAGSTRRDLIADRTTDWTRDGTEGITAGIHPHNVHGGEEGVGTVGGGYAAFGAEQFRVGGFELSHFPAATITAPPPTTQHFDDFRLPRFVPLGPFGPAALMRGRAAEQGRFVGLGGEYRRRLACV